MEVRVIAMFAMVVENIVLHVIPQEPVPHVKVIPNARGVKATPVTHVNGVRETKSVTVVRETESVRFAEVVDMWKGLVLDVSVCKWIVRLVWLLADVANVQDMVIANTVPALVSGYVMYVMVLASVHHVQEVVSVKPVEEMLIAQHARIAMVNVLHVKEGAMCG